MDLTLSAIEWGVILSIVLGAGYFISTGLSIYFLVTDNPATKASAITMGVLLCLSLIPIMVGAKLSGVKISDSLPQLDEGLRFFPLLCIALVAGVIVRKYIVYSLVILATSYFLGIFIPLLNFIVK